MANIYTDGTGLTMNLSNERHYDKYFKTPFRDFKMTDDDHAPYQYSRSILPALENNIISEVFFSQRNIDYLQSMLIKETKRYSGKDIGKQSENELLTIMRSIYLQYCDNNVAKYKETVSYLNQQVLFDAVPRIVTRLEQYIGYIRDAGLGRTFIPRAENVSITGTKVNGGFDRVNL